MQAKKLRFCFIWPDHMFPHVSCLLCMTFFLQLLWSNHSFMNARLNLLVIAVLPFGAPPEAPRFFFLVVIVVGYNINILITPGMGREPNIVFT